MSTDGFQSNGRHLIRRSIGSGSFGMVFEAFDQDRQAVVALKMLTHMSPEALLQFKREFRALADLSHPNLVGLFELFSEDDRAYFTMELVAGTPFSAWVREEPRPPRPGGSSGHQTLDRELEMDGALPSLDSSQEASKLHAVEMATWRSDSDRTMAVPVAGPGEAVKDAQRLRAALRQLAEGVSALHDAGKLHRDLKSNNVLVDPGGRVVVLDFGLVLDLVPQDMLGTRLPSKLVGTPSHMAPEQGATGVTTQASDWYSVGVMLYESLSGRLPFIGAPMEVIQAKNEVEAPDIRDVARGVPEDLAALAMDLLRRNPLDRPEAAEILLRLGKTAGERRPDPPAPRRTLVGREKEMERLLRAFTEVEAGESRTVLLHGNSGLGKTFLVRRFLRTLQQEHPGALLLFGRCYEQESVPFKAVDSLIDALSQTLRVLPAAEVEALLPRHIQALAKLFPVLQQVAPISRAGARVAEIRDPQELRRRAFGALRELLARLGESRPLALVIDDLHWGDLDSAALLLELLRPPDAPRVLMVLCYRSEEEGSAPTLSTLLPELLHLGLHPTEIYLTQLSSESSQVLARSLVDDPERADAIVREAGGNPLFIAELAQAPPDETGTHGDETMAAVFDRVLLGRVAALPVKSRDLLHLLAVAGRPMEWETLRRAARIDPSSADPFAPLRVARLARARGLPGRRMLETYHDRVRECVADSIGPEDWKTCHLSLASALEASSRPDPQALAFHYLEAGLEEMAAGYAAKAGAEAEAALAFEQAAAFYAQSISLRDPADPEISPLRLRMAEALTHAGQSPRAAEVFLEAAASAPPELVRKLRRRAAEEYFKSGHLEQALAISGELLEWAGERIRKGRLGAILSMLWSRFRLRRRGFSFRSRDAASIPAEELEKLDILWTVAHGLGAYDIFRASDLQARQFHRALDAGEPHRVMRGMAHETVMQGATGAETRVEVQRLEALTTSLAERIGTPDALARAHIASGLVALSAGRWTACAEHLEKGESMLVTGASYEFHVCQTYGLRVRCIQGRFREVAHRYHELLQVARHQGDKHMAANLQIVVGTLLRLVDDEPQLALDELAEAEALLPAGLFTTAHFDLFMQRGNALLYLGQAAEASAWVDSQRPALNHSLLLRTLGMRISALDLEIRVDLARMAAGDASRAGAAARRIKVLRREASDYGQALGLKDDGLLLWMQGRREESLSRLQEAVMALDACQMAFHSATVRRVRGLLLGGPVGADLVAQAEAWMEDQGIANPDAATRVIAPIRL